MLGISIRVLPLAILILSVLTLYRLVCSTNPHKFHGLPPECFLFSSLEPSPGMSWNVSCLFCVNLTWLCQSVWPTCHMACSFPPLSFLFMNFFFRLFRSFDPSWWEWEWEWGVLGRKHMPGLPSGTLFSLALPLYFSFFFAHSAAIH